jgi:hypothetical protein
MAKHLALIKDRAPPRSLAQIKDFTREAEHRWTKTQGPKSRPARELWAEKSSALELEKKLRKNATGLVLLGAQQDTNRAAMELRT